MSLERPEKLCQTSLVLQRVARLGLLAISVLSCVDDTKGSTGENAAKLAPYVLDAPPVIPKTTDFQFGDQIKILGYKLSPEGALNAGTEVKITLYWKVERALESGWLLFTHLVDDQGNRLVNIDQAGPLRQGTNGSQALPPGQWKPGKIYVDELTFKMPDSASDVTLAVGVWKGEQRLNVTRGATDKEKRALVVKLKNSTPNAAANKPTKTNLPTLLVTKLEGAAPTIDGKLDDEAWKNSPRTINFVDVSTGQQNTMFPVNAFARLAWDDQNLYAAFEVNDDDLLGGFKPDEKDPHLWEKTCVELMIDPDGDGDNRDYYEIQVSPQNLIFDSQFDDYNQPRGGPNGPFGHQEWSIQGKTAVSVNGTIDKSDDKDRGYTVEMAIPWSSFSKAKSSPPTPGETWRMNFYAMRRNGGVAWSAIMGQGNFHKASRFGKVTFTTKQALTSASGSASSASSAAPKPENNGPQPASGDPAGIIGPPPPPPTDEPPRQTVKPMPAPKHNNPSSGFIKRTPQQ